MSLYIVLAAINVALWIVGMIFHVGPAVHLFPVVAVGLFAADHFERRESHRASVPSKVEFVTGNDPLRYSPLLTQPLLAFGSTMRKQTFLPGVSVEQQSARLVVRSKFQQHSTRSVRAALLKSNPNSTADLAV